MMDVASQVLNKNTQAFVLIDPFTAGTQAHNVMSLSKRIAQREFVYANGLLNIHYRKEIDNQALMEKFQGSGTGDIVAQERNRIQNLQDVGNNLIKNLFKELR